MPAALLRALVGAVAVAAQGGECDYGYGGADCGACATGWVGYPTCVECTVSGHCEAGGHVSGVAAPDALACVCLCEEGWSGVACGIADNATAAGTGDDEAFLSGSVVSFAALVLFCGGSLFLRSLRADPTSFRLWQGSSDDPDPDHDPDHALDMTAATSVDLLDRVSGQQPGESLRSVGHERTRSDFQLSTGLSEPLLSPLLSAGGPSVLEGTFSHLGQSTTLLPPLPGPGSLHSAPHTRLLSRSPARSMAPGSMPVPPRQGFALRSSARRVHTSPTMPPRKPMGEVCGNVPGPRALVERPGKQARRGAAWDRYSQAIPPEEIPTITLNDDKTLEEVVALFDVPREAQRAGLTDTAHGATAGSVSMLLLAVPLWRYECGAAIEADPPARAPVRKQAARQGKPLKKKPKPSSAPRDVPKSPLSARVPGGEKGLGKPGPPPKRKAVQPLCRSLATHLATA